MSTGHGGMPAAMRSPEAESLQLRHVSLPVSFGRGGAVTCTTWLPHPCPCTSTCQTAKMSLRMSYGIVNFCAVVNWSKALTKEERKVSKRRLNCLPQWPAVCSMRRSQAKLKTMHEAHHVRAVTCMRTEHASQTAYPSSACIHPTSMMAVA